MAFENLQSIVNDAQSAADRLIADYQKASTDLAAANAMIADMQAQAAGMVQPLANKLDAAAPQSVAPQTDPAA